MLGFARNSVFLRVNGGSVAQKSCLACATVAGVAALPWNLSRTARAVELRVPGDLFSSLLLLCCCALHVLRHFVCIGTGAPKRCVLEWRVASLLC